ncbi:MAG: 30S ribosomal protein S13 [Candidatus Diapherotrites archaeon]|nr:30S ribosomal protein S13 [Candidatus Diapherotrites archaeon]
MQEQELRLIVRIVNKDLDGRLPIYRALMKIKGISHRMARSIAYVFEKNTKVPFDMQLGNLQENMDSKLEEIIQSPQKFGIPKWTFNRQKDIETGTDIHHVMVDLDFDLRKDLERMKRIKSYRGVRHMYGLPVRGQRTRSSFRKRGATVGVMKKDAKTAAGPAKPAAGAKEEKKK